MIAGLLDAMRADVDPSIRIVWMCLENHANGSRQWAMTDAEIADEVHLSPSTVARARIALQGRTGGKGSPPPVLPPVIRAAPRKRRRTLYTMIRSYPDGCPKPRHEPEVAARVEPKLTRQNDDSTPELTRQIDESFFHQRVHQKEEEDARGRATPDPVSKSSRARKEDRRIEGVPPRPPEPPVRVPFPDDDPELQPEELAEIRAAGHDPAELRDEVREWANEAGATSSNWGRVLVHWGRRTPPKRRRSADRGQPRHVDHGARATELLARVRANFAAGLMG